MSEAASPAPSPRPPKKLHAHLAVYDQAKELCLSTYEELMRLDEVWKQWQSQHPGFSRRHLELAFVKRYVFRFIPAARAMMAAQLTTTTDPALKDSIYEALVLDGTLIRGRGRPMAGQKGKPVP